MYPSQLAFHAVFQRHDPHGGYRDPFREIRGNRMKIRDQRKLREIRVRDREIREYFGP